MAGPTVASAEIELDFDGSRLPAQARAAAGKAGKGAAQGFTKSFNDGISKWGGDVVKQMDRAGELGTESFSKRVKRILKRDLDGYTDQLTRALTSQKGFDALVKEFGSVDEAVKRVNEGLKKLEKTGELSQSRWRGTEQDLRKWIAAAREAEAQAKDLADQTERDAEQTDLARRRKEAFRLEAQKLSAALKDVNLALRSQGNWDTLIKNTDDADAAQSRLVDTMHRLRTAGVLSNDQFEIMSSRVRELSAGTKDLNTELERNTKTSKSSRDMGDRLASSWRRLDGTVKLVLATIAFASSDVAALGSAVGSSLTVLASSVGPVLTAGAAAIAIFAGLNDEIDTLPEAFQGAAAEFDEFSDALGKVQDAMQAAAGPALEKAFQSLQVTVAALQPALELVATAVGDTFAQLAASIAPGTEGFKVLARLIGEAAPVFRVLADAAITFGEALGNVFVASIPFVHEFANWISELARRFLEWTQSLEGQNALQAWFESGMTIMQAFEPLVVAIAQALADLVTPETIDMTVQFLETLTQFTPILGEILAALGDLQILQVLAELLLAIGLAVQPLLPAFSQMGAILAESVIAAFHELTPALISITTAIAPLLPQIAELAAGLLYAALEAVVPLLEELPKLAPFFVQIMQAAIDLLPEIILIGTALGQVLVEALKIVTPMLPSLTAFILSLMSAMKILLPIITTLVTLGLQFFIKILQAAAVVVGAFIDILRAVMSPFEKLQKAVTKNGELFDALNDVIETSGDFFADWGDVIVDTAGWVSDAISGLIGWFNDLFSAASEADSAAASASSRRGAGGGFASGGIVSGAAYRLTGEAGPEAIVPLNRPLSMVDPSVRALSAFAQGMTGGQSLTGGRGGGGVIVEEGAIQINGALQPERVAINTVNRLAQRIGS